MSCLSYGLHAGTPDVAVVGSAGMPVLALRFLRRPDAPDAPARILQSRTVVSIPERKVRLYGSRPLTDEAGHLLPDAVSVTALSGQAVILHTADGDTSYSFSDAAGRPLWNRSAQGTVNIFTYEPPGTAGRLLMVTEAGTGDGPRVRERCSYAAADDADAKARNLAGAAVVLCDNAGVTETFSVALTGQPLEGEQRLLLADAPEPDWSAVSQPATEAPLPVSGTYDSTGNRLSQTNAAGVTISTAYDVSGAVRGTRVRYSPEPGAPAEEVVTMRDILYRADGVVLSQTAGSGITETFAYDDRTQYLTRHVVRRPEGHPSGALLLSDLHYDYDPAGNILSLEDKGADPAWHNNQQATRWREYGYDTLYRLTSATGRERVAASQRRGPLPRERVDRTAGSAWSPYTQTYEYDNGDNLITQTHSGTASWTRTTAVSARSNRGVAQESGQPAVVDAHEAYLTGGLRKALDDGRLLAWHADGQLSGVTPVSRGEGRENDAERYRYADPGTRVRKVRMRKVAGGMQTAVTTYAGGCETRRRVLGSSVQLDISVTEAGGLRVIHDVLKGEVHLRYGFADHLGSVSGETDEAGSVMSREEYYPYGGSAGADEEAEETKDRTRRYGGKERDATGLIYYGWRYYQAEAGRWLSADPGGLVDGMNLFHMCRNNPVRYSDNNGLDSIDNVAHFIWIGGSDISRETSGNIIDFKRKNPDFKVNLWTDNLKKIENNIVSQGLSLSGFKKNVAIRSISTLYENDSEIIGSSLTMSRMSVLKSAVSREVNGSYNNLAAASDLLRYAILAQEGGIYLDVDVHTKGRMDTYTEMNEGILIYQGDDQGVSNAVMASEADGANINTILNYALSPYDRNGKMPTFQENQESPMATYFRLYGLRSTLRNDNYLSRSTQIGSGNATSAMYGAKRFYPQARRNLTLSVTGPRMLVNFLSASEADGTAREDLLFPEPGFFGQRGALNRTTQVHEHNPDLNDGGHWTGLLRAYRGGRRNSV